MDTIFEACCELAVWLICELFFEYILIGLLKLSWLILGVIFWVIGATLVFIFTAGTIRAAGKQMAVSSPKSLSVYYHRQHKYLEYNTVMFLGALVVTASSVCLAATR